MKKLIFFTWLIACCGMSYAQTISWAHLQWEAATTVQTGDEFEALGLVFAAGITDAAEPDGAAIKAQLGYGQTANPTDASWTWKDAPFNGTWGQNLAYQVKTDPMNVAGVFHYSFRFRLADVDEWAYAGSDGLWDETEHPCKTFTVTSSDVYTISWAHLQWEASTTVNAGADFEAMGLAFAEGLTNAETKKHDAISAQIGYGASDNPTDPEWTWKDAAFHSEWGNNFAYQEKIASPSVNGTYYYSFRFKINESYGVWVYAGVNGLWENSEHPCKTFEVVGGTEPEHTALLNVDSDNEETFIYDILGNRLVAPQKGINIINGKKVFIH